MSSKEQQRTEMRDKILKAAIVVFAELGFVGASTRNIAAQAGISQGLLTYHFKNKTQLWYDTVDRMFQDYRDDLGESFFDGSVPAPNDAVLRFLTYISSKPHLLRFIIDGGKEWNERSEYLIKNHLTRVFDNFKQRLPEHLQGEIAPHVFYAWLGACTTIYSVPAECEHLTGVDPTTPESIFRHAELITQLFGLAQDA